MKNSSLLFSGLKLLLLSVILTQCVSTKTLPVKPSWIEKKPVDSESYLGIGTSPKSSKNTDYQQLAKSNALNDLASEISVRISNTSLLYTLSSNNTLKETFDSKTYTSTKEDLEGYELVDSFEDETNYWVFYKLSKQKYREIKQIRINKAIDLALSKYQKATSLIETQQYYSALILLFKAVEDVKPYITEPLTATYQQKEINFGTTLLNDILFCINEIKISSDSRTVNVTRAKMVNEELLTFFVSNQKGANLENIPLIAEFTGGPLVNDNARTSISGAASFSIPTVKSNNKTEYFTARVDVNSILQDATKDFTIRKLFKSIKSGEFIKQINIRNPKVYINTLVNVSNQEFAQSLKNTCAAELVKFNVDLVENTGSAEYKLEIESKLKVDVSNGFKASVDAIITVKSSENKIVYQRNITDLSETNVSVEVAKKEALKRTNDYVTNRIIPDIVEQLF